MPAAEKTMYDALVAWAGLTALVGTRVFDTRYKPGETLPLIVYQRIDTVFEQAVTGAVLSSSVPFQIKVISDDLAEMRTVSLQVFKALEDSVTAIVEDVTFTHDRQQPRPEAGLFSRIIEATVLLQDAA